MSVCICQCARVNVEEELEEADVVPNIDIILILK